jgi:hypothetical protein
MRRLELIASPQMHRRKHMDFHCSHYLPFIHERTPTP